MLDSLNYINRGFAIYSLTNMHKSRYNTNDEDCFMKGKDNKLRNQSYLDCLLEQEENCQGQNPYNQQ